jgi:3'-phosphoadenosine 5'-phosphosulfate sulfotransferase (PAPS reductase)/FAD synthetase
MGNAKAVYKEDARIWVAPFLHKTKTQLNKYIEDHGLRRNPVVDHLHMSGECLCGAYARKGELEEIGLWYPRTAERIRRIEREVEAAGKPWKWEDAGPPEWYEEMRQGQMFLDDAMMPMPLCSDCGKQEEQ